MLWEQGPPTNFDDQHSFAAFVADTSRDPDVTLHEDQAGSWLDGYSYFLSQPRLAAESFAVDGLPTFVLTTIAVDTALALLWQSV